jgi:hypothetical protein
MWNHQLFELSLYFITCAYLEVGWFWSNTFIQML